jgi:dihydroorotate dehydrogenase (fumarate)
MPMYVIKQMDQAGANGFVLFNKLFQPDIDIEQRKMKQPFNLSYKGENRLPLRYAGLLYENIKGDVCSNTGIMDTEDLVAMILAGANAVQIVSTIYKNGPIQISRMLQGLTDYMQRNKFNSINEMRGLLSFNNIKDPYAYTRAQYVDFLMNTKEFTKNMV